MRQLNLDQLLTLVTAADLGSLAEAARTLHLSAPAVSLHVHELEQRVGTALLERGRGRARLTPAGEVLVNGGRGILQGCHDVLERTRQRGLGLAGTLRLATTAGVEPELLPRLIGALGQRIPGAELRLDALGSRESIARIRAGLLDLAVVALPLETGPDVELVRWRTDPVGAYLPRGWKAPAAVSAAWLARRPWASFDSGTQLHLLLSSWFTDAGVPSNPRFAINQPDALLALARAGEAAALLPLTFDIASERNIVRRPLSPAAPRQLAIAHRKSERDPLVSAGLEAILPLARAKPKPAPTPR